LEKGAQWRTVSAGRIARSAGPAGARPGRHPPRSCRRRGDRIVAVPRRLEELRLASCPIGDDGVIALLALGGLRRLAIDGVGAGDRAAHAIADASHHPDPPEPYSIDAIGVEGIRVSVVG
jgi:hypothetical protein